MIGNDVIDLAAASTESNWKRKGFLQKLFTDSEQEIIKSHADPELMVWVLWSMKEAAYKIYNRETGIRAFMPLKFECSVSQAENGFTGTATCCNTGYTTKTTIEGELLHTVAATEPGFLDRIIFVRSGAVTKDSNGLPFVASDKGEGIRIASKSHHGRYAFTVAAGQ